jgi:hypothetical protein
MRIKCTYSMLVTALVVCVNVSAVYGQRITPGIDPPEFERVGQSGFQFLHLPTVARNAALANIRGLTNSDVSAVFSNPASLVDIGRIDASFSRLDYVADITYMTAAVAMNLGNWGVFGLHVASLDAGELIRTENTYDPDFDLTYRSGDLGTFKAGDVLYGLSYARSVTDRLSVGANFGRIEERLDSTHVDNWNLDFGLFFHTGFRSLTLSMVARNFGPDAEFTGFSEVYGLPQSVRMPLDFQLGISYDLIDNASGGLHKLTAYLEGTHPNDSRERVHTAFEYTFLNTFSLRGGYKFNYDEQSLTLGGGLNFSLRSVSGRIDYAYLDYGLLSTVHLFTVGFGFGK